MNPRFLFLLLLGFLACTPPLKTSGGEPPPPEEKPPYSTIGPGDLLAIKVVGEEGLSGDYRVSPDCTITFPWLQQLQVNGLLLGEIQTKIANGLREGYLRDPQVIVDIKEANSNKIYIFGYVKTPGTYRYKDNMSIVEALTLAGGPTADGDPNRTRITRVRDGVEVSYTIRVKDIVEGKTRNVELLPGDILSVPFRRL